MYLIERPPIELLDSIVNNPAVHQSTGYPEHIPVTFKQLYDIHPRNMAFSCPFGAMVFEYVDDDTFNSHFYFLPGSPGIEIKKHAALMLRTMFTIYNASVIVGYPPRENRAVKVMGTALGYQKVKTKPVIDTLGRICDTYKVIPQWVLQHH